MKSLNQNTNTNYPIVLIPTSALRPHEMHDREWAHQLKNEILSKGVWTTPLAVTRSGLIVMDGHHRLVAARALGLVNVPAVLMSYQEGNVDLSSWRDETVTSEQILRAANSGTLLPQKTTKHTFQPPLGETWISLHILRKENVNSS